MNLPTIIGISSSAVTLYDFISKKLKDDNEVFKKQLHKNIKAVCEILNETYEFKNFITPITNEIIYDEVIKALKNKKQINIDEIQKKLVLPKDISEYLIKLVDAKLQTSFEYCQRDYNAWSKQNMNEIKSDIRDIKSDTYQILQILKEILLKFSDWQTRNRLDGEALRIV